MGVLRFEYGVWSSNKLIMACLDKKWEILESIIASVGSNSPHLNDRDVIPLAVKNHPSSLKHASQTLRHDREFILSLVTAIDHVLHYAPPSMKYDKAILLAALARAVDRLLIALKVSS